MFSIQTRINELVNELFEQSGDLMGDIIGSVPIPFSENSCLYEGHKISFLQMCDIFNGLLDKPLNTIPPIEALELLACFMNAAKVQSLFLSGQNITNDGIIDFAINFDYGKHFDKNTIFRTSKTKLAFEAYAQKINRFSGQANLELAAYALAEFARISPFKIANGHCARLVMNYVLLRHDIPWIFFEAKDKSQYDESLNKYKQSGNLTPVIELIGKVAQRQIRPWLKNCSAEEKAWREALVSRSMNIYSSKKLSNLAKIQELTRKR